MLEVTSNWIALIIGVIALVIGVIALVGGVVAYIFSIRAFKAHAKELHDSTEIKRLEIEERRETAALTRLEIKLKLLNARQELLKYLKELIVMPRNNLPYFLIRRTVTIPFQFDENQQIFHGRDKCSSNQYYQTILNEFQSKRTDVELYFPEQLNEYNMFIDLAEKTVNSIEYHQNSEVIKEWDHELEERTFDSFDSFVSSATHALGILKAF